MLSTDGAYCLIPPLVPITIAPLALTYGVSAEAIFSSTTSFVVTWFSTVSTLACFFAMYIPL